MSRFVFKLPDLGEGTVEAEIVAWRVQPGDLVKEDDVVAEVMTEKAVVEVPAPVSGKVVSVTGVAGDKLAVGSELIVFETEEEVSAASAQPGATASQESGSTPDDDEFYVFEPGELTPAGGSKAPHLRSVPDTQSTAGASATSGNNVAPIRPGAGNQSGAN